MPLLDIGGQPDDFMHPYRGHNQDMAFTPDSGELPATELARRLAYQIGHTREGYKGGDFLVHGRCGLWVAEYDEVTYRGIRGVTPDGVIQTTLMSGSRD